MPPNSNEKVQLTTSYIGEGQTLFHVSVWCDDWDGQAYWLVAAPTLVEAFITAKAQYGDLEEESRPDQWDGYEIGILI